MIIFAAPHYLLLLLLIPFFFLGMGLWLWGRHRRLRRFGDEALVNELMPSWSRGKLWVRTVLLSLAFFFFGDDRNKCAESWNVSPALYAVAARAIRPARDERYPSVDAFADAWRRTRADV